MNTFWGGQAATQDGGGGLAEGSGTAITDNKAVRGDTPDGLQGSLVEITDAGDIILSGDVTLQRKAAEQLRVLKQIWVERIYSEAGGTAVGGFEDGSITLANSKIISWTSGGGAGGAGDTGIRKTAPGVQLDTDGGSGLGRRLTGRVVEASTVGSGAPNVLAVTESRTLITNEGAAAEAYNTLPAAAAGVGPFGFYCQNANGIRATANAGDTIRIEGSESAAAGFIRSIVVGSLIWLECINSTEWVASCKPAGTWTVDL